MPSAYAQAAASRSERRSIVSGLTGRHTPLGNHHDGSGPVQLRAETSTNIGTRSIRQQHIGDVDVEVVGDDAIHDWMVEGDDDIANERPAQRRRTQNGVRRCNVNWMVEGDDDIANDRPAQRRRTQNGVHQRNVHINFGADTNDPAARFHHVSRAFASLDALTHAVAQSFAAPPQAPPRSLIVIVRDYQHTSEILAGARASADVNDIAVYESVLQRFVAEIASFPFNANVSE